MLKTTAFLISYFWIIIGVLSVYFALTYGFFQEGIPQAGFFPAVAGTILIILGLANSINLYRQQHKFFTEDGSRSRVVLIIVSIALYIGFYNLLGFVVTTFMTAFSILRILQPRNTLYLLVISIIITVMLYLVFHTFLQIQFPKGFLGRIL